MVKDNVWQVIMMVLRWFWRLFGDQPDNSELEEELDEVLEDFEQLKVEMKAFQLEIWELVDARLDPLTKKVGTRLQRSEKKDGIDPNVQRSGLISPSDIAKWK